MATASISVFIAALETLYVTIDGRGEPLVAATDDIDVILHPAPVITAEGLVAGAQAGAARAAALLAHDGDNVLEALHQPRHVDRHQRVPRLAPDPRQAAVPLADALAPSRQRVRRAVGRGQVAGLRRQW